KTVRQLLYLPRHQLPSGICLRRYSVRVMVRPARLLALLDWSDLESSSSRRGRIHPSLPEGGHPNPESGMTTPSFWGRMITGLAPAGALPLQAARIVCITFCDKMSSTTTPREDSGRGGQGRWTVVTNSAPKRPQALVRSVRHWLSATASSDSG